MEEIEVAKMAIKVVEAGVARWGGRGHGAQPARLHAPVSCLQLRGGVVLLARHLPRRLDLLALLALEPILLRLQRRLERRLPPQLLLLRLLLEAPLVRGEPLGLLPALRLRLEDALRLGHLDQIHVRPLHDVG